MIAKTEGPRSVSVEDYESTTIEGRECPVYIFMRHCPTSLIRQVGNATKLTNPDRKGCGDQNVDLHTKDTNKEPDYLSATA